MIKTITNIIKAPFRERKKTGSDFDTIGWMQEKWIKHQEDKTQKQVRLNGLTIHYKRPYELLHSYKEIFGNEIYKFDSANAAPVIFDCGSNIGLSILYFKKRFPAATVLAFEPDSNNFSLLKQNISGNGLTGVELHEAAVWTTDGNISFEANESEGSHISEKASSHHVKAIRLKRLLDAYPVIEFLKMDIEGAEAAVIEDCKDTLHKARNIFLEYHGKAMDVEKLNQMLDIVKQNGFSVYIRNAADNLRFPFVEKSSGTIYDVQLNLFCYK